VNGPAVAVTFDPHPIALLAPDRLLPLLTTVSDRAELLHAAGADAVVILKTTPNLLALEPREFLDSVFGEQLAARAVIEGFNFQFGRGRTGSTATIAEWCREQDIPFRVFPPFRWHDILVSSSRVREALEKGDVASAADLLGRPYRLRGTVGHGAQRGQSLGFPTANLDQPLTLVPGDGVYAARAQLADMSEWPAAVNVGPNPTFGEQARKVEAHLIGFAGNLYGRPLALDFVSRLRDTQKFGSVEELKSQLQTDIRLASLATRERGASSRG
jgi:riboflavin kinase/FMN adenylyltransferase